MQPHQHAIFIGYRREDTADATGRVYDRLRQAFGDEAIFKDVDSLPIGTNFGEHILSILPRCRVFLAMIGPAWINATDEGGVRRLERPEDWVRIELEAALGTRGLQVVPVLINGARMPERDQLPASLKALPSLHGAIVRRDPDFHRDMDRLIEALNAGTQTGLVTVAAPTVTETSTQNWSRIEGSHDARDYRDFVEVFPNAPEVFEARRRKRQLEDWGRIQKEDVEAIATFAQLPLFDSLLAEVHGTLLRATEKRRKSADEAEAARLIQDAEAQRTRVLAEQKARREEEETQRQGAVRALSRVLKDWGVKGGSWALEAFLAEASADLLQELAESGDTNARVLWGVALAGGAHGPRDDRRAVDLFSEAAHSGSREGRFHLADMIAADRVSSAPANGTPSEVVADLYRLAAEQGFAEAQHRFGKLLELGKGIAQKEQAAEWYRRAAEQGHHEAQCALGLLLATSQNTQKRTEATDWYRKAAEGGNVPAQYLLGQTLEFHSGGNAEAMKWYRKAAERGHAEAQFRLGLLLRRGKVEPQDDTSAARWVQASAEQGFAPAQEAFAEMLLKGFGVLRNEAVALEWYRKAAKEGNPHLQTKLGDLLYERVSERPEAAAWYRRAAEQGHAPAQLAVGRMLENGIGIARNRTQAVQWYEKAAKSAGSAYKRERNAAQQLLQRLRERQVVQHLIMLACGVALCIAAVIVASVVSHRG